MPSKREIETAVAALTSPDRAAFAVRLLTVMFPHGSEYRCSLVALSAAVGVPRNTTLRWLTVLTDAGFLSKERGALGTPNTYRLHLPPLVRR